MTTSNYKMISVESRMIRFSAITIPAEAEAEAVRAMDGAHRFRLAASVSWDHQDRLTLLM